MCIFFVTRSNLLSAYPYMEYSTNCKQNMPLRRHSHNETIFNFLSLGTPSPFTSPIERYSLLLWEKYVKAELF
jgi:hypothetical protein